MGGVRGAAGLGRDGRGENGGEGLAELRPDVGVVYRRSHFALDENPAVGHFAGASEADRRVAGAVVELELARPKQVPFFGAVGMERDQVRLVLDERGGGKV